MKMLKTKHFRRLAVFLAMIAPAVYLFGSLFSALNGAHGQSVLADGETSYVDMTVQKDGISYDRVLYFPDDDCTFTLSYVATSYNVYIGSDCYYSDSSDVVSSFLPLADSLSSFTPLVRAEVTSGFVNYVSLLRDDQCCAFSLDGYWLIEFFGKTVYYDSNDASNHDSTLNGIPISYRRQPMSFSNLVSGSATLNSYRRIPVLQPTVDVPASVNESDYIFGQFFARDNFLVEWGRNALSAEPKGFAPFGAFWRYLDINVLHLSNDQVGLMGYGYIYYACHVLLFDIGFILVTFFLDFIQKIADKFTGGE